jgi:thiol:disulfide interchange protein DsbD
MRRGGSWLMLTLGMATVAEAADPQLTGTARTGQGPQGATLEVELVVPEGWHLWSMDPGPGPLPLRIEAPFQWEENAAWLGPAPRVAYDRGFQRDLAHHPSGSHRFRRRLAQLPTTGPVEVRGQICTEATCLNQRLRLDLAPTGELAPRPSLVVQTRSEDRSAPRPGAETGPQPAGSNALAAATFDGGGEGLWGFLSLAFLFGLGALATPCVFPAIPLTVSFFSKYRSHSVARAARLAATYALTIVVAFTAAGVLVSLVFGVTGIQQLAAHPVFNLFLAGLLVLFGLNLMGAFELNPPGWMLATVNRWQSRVGRPGSEGGGASDYAVVALAALTASTVFFTCTVGFVGVVLVAAAQGEVLWPTFGMLAFSTAFSLPFFLLALFPTATRRFRSGPWLSSTRVTLGILELAAATKFLSNADLVWRWSLFTREVVLAFWIPLFLLAGLFLLGKIKLGPESAADAEGRIPVAQSLVAVMLFGFSTYLAVGLFQGRAFGSWLDGWLPPTRYPGLTASAGIGSHLPWIEDLAQGRQQAAARQQLVFVNYTGYTCTNCRYMEEAVFPRPEIAGLLSEMTLVELITDGGEPRHETYRLDQVERFGTAALPFYSVETADGTVLGTFPSSTNDPEAFRTFLEAAMARAEASTG